MCHKVLQCKFFNGKSYSKFLNLCYTCVNNIFWAKIISGVKCNLRTLRFWMATLSHWCHFSRWAGYKCVASSAALFITLRGTGLDSISPTRLLQHFFKAFLNIDILKQYTNGFTIELAKWRMFPVFHYWR